MVIGLVLAMKNWALDPYTMIRKFRRWTCIMIFYLFWIFYKIQNTKIKHKDIKKILEVLEITWVPLARQKTKTILDFIENHENVLDGTCTHARPLLEGLNRWCGCMYVDHFLSDPIAAIDLIKNLIWWPWLTDIHFNMVRCIRYLVYKVMWQTRIKW
jgi:hypothetical protein